MSSTSLWAGAGGSRTPLHKDDVSAVIFQAVGSKRFFLASRGAVADAVEGGTLPRAVLENGNTEDHCVDGCIDAVFGLDANEPPVVRGELAVLREGDCLVLPAGLYHDVECDANSPASMSLTVRFDLDDGDGDGDGGGGDGDDAAAPADAPANAPAERPAAGKKDLHKFLMKLALKKAMRDARTGAAAPRPPEPPSVQQ